MKLPQVITTIWDRMTREPRDPDEKRVSSSPRTVAGVLINPDNAVTIPAVWACLRYLSQTVAMPPWHVLLEGAQGPEVQRRHPVDWMLWKRPSDEWSSFQFRETLTHWALRWGNGFAEIEPDAIGRPMAMWPIHPERVEVCRAEVAEEDSYGDMIPAGALFYEVNNGTWGKTVLSQRRMFHIRGFGEGPVGVNVIEYAAQSLGWARAAQIFGASFFGNGMNVGGVVKNKRPLSVDGMKKQRAELDRLYGTPWRAHKVAILDNDTDFTPIGIDPDKAQFIMTHQHLVEEVCRWFGVPPHKVMHLLRGTFSNIEHQSIEVVVDSITPWAKRFEDEADHKLFGQNRQGYYSKINLNALMRGDAKSRAEFYQAMWSMGAYSPNRILTLEDENTIGEPGDKHIVQQGFTTLDRIGTEPEPVTDQAPAEIVEDDQVVAIRQRFEARVGAVHAE